MNKSFLKKLTEAHSWVGLVISGLLFVVFFAGSISLFRAEINQWSLQPHFSLPTQTPLPLSKIMEKAVEGENFDPKEHLTLVLPSKHNPYYEAFIDVHHEEGQEDYVGVLIDPVTGEKIANHDDFNLAEFIYDLHIDLNIPAGKYVIGFVALFFFFALVSGIFIHARKLVSNFFQYRNGEHKRSQLLDMHNVVGVMSLPFTIMYAISGLIFNLVIIYQIAFALVLYKGDQQALLDDAGYMAVTPVWVDKSWTSPNIDELYQQTINKYEITPRVARVYNYGDESAVLHFFGAEKSSLTNSYEVTYHLKDNSILFTKDEENPNTLVKGLYVISKLHFGDFAGIDLRILYFILGIGVCGLIVTGNLLWIEKRSKQKSQSRKTLAFVNNFTLWGTGGVVLATSVAFLVERLTPVTVANRSDYMLISFVAALICVAIALIFNHSKKAFLAYLLQGAAAMVVLTVICDWILFSDAIITLSQQGVWTIIGTEIGMLVVSAILFYAGKKLIKSNKVKNATLYQTNNPNIIAN